MEIQDTQHIDSAELDEERQKQAREYARTRRRLSYVDMGIGALGLLLLLGTGLDRWLRDALQNVSHGIAVLDWQPRPDWFPVQIALYFLIIIIVYQAVTSPLSYYSGFVLSHRYGLSTMTLKAWLTD